MRSPPPEGPPTGTPPTLRDSEAMGEAGKAIGAGSGRVDVLLHAGGLEISRLLPDKSTAEFDLVFDVKADGWFNLLHALGDLPIGAAVVFSSIAGRFGNGGQTDYSAANDLLGKSVSSFRTTRPETRGIAIDWTAWGGIGMASRGSIPKMMALAGIDMLPPAIGIPVVRREITAGGNGGEIVVAGALGAMLDMPASPLEPPPAAGAGAGPMVGRVGAAADDGVVILTDLDPTDQPFLDDHRIDGTPVLPGVMGIEAFAEAARLLAPGWAVDGDRGRRVPRPVQVVSRRAPPSGSGGARRRRWRPPRRHVPARWAAHAGRPARAGDDPLHRPRGARPHRRRPRDDDDAATARRGGRQS